MRQGYPTEDDMRRGFGELRSADGPDAAPFGQMWSQARRVQTIRARRRRNYRLAGLAILVMMTGSAIVRYGMLDPRLDAGIEDLVSWNSKSEQWQGPLDFLLVTPGSEFLTSTPQIDLQDLWDIQTDIGQEVVAR